MVPEAESIGDWLQQGTSDPGEVADRYDAWAQGYDDDLGAWSYRAPAVVAETLLARQPETHLVLDVGCGTGLVGRTLRAHGFGGELRGLDISEASLEVARESGAYSQVERADLQQRLPLEDGAVGALVCAGVMTYLPEVEALWREFARVVSAGGLIVVTQREDLWDERSCQAVVDALQAEGVWTQLDLTGPAPYLPEGYGEGDAVACYYLTARVS